MEAPFITVNCPAGTLSKENCPALLDLTVVTSPLYDNERTAPFIGTFVHISLTKPWIVPFGRYAGRASVLAPVTESLSSSLQPRKANRKIAVVIITINVRFIYPPTIG